MKSCSEYKALIDLNAGIDASEVADLSAHLQTCTDCTVYSADAARTQHLLRALRKRLTTRDPLDDAFERLSARSVASRRQLYWSLALLAAAITAPFAVALRGELPGADDADSAVCLTEFVKALRGLSLEARAVLSLVAI